MTPTRPPPPTPDHRPWTRWWWLGNAVDPANLTRQLEAFAAAGLGGVEICPIYGVRGAEDRDLPFLSGPWVERLAHTLRECRRLDLGCDLTTGTGWPFGGPWVTPPMASHGMVPVRLDASEGPVSLTLPAGDLVCLLAFPADGEPLDLASSVAAGHLSWSAPAGTWHIRGLVARSPIQQVKRAAPGGAGSVLDPFAPEALGHYLARFTTALATLDAPPPRAHFHDSFEYFGADWTPALPEAFLHRHGYDLRRHLRALLGEGDAETAARVTHDYRATLHDLHLAWLRRWREWTHARGSQVRLQAHGSPGNLLDHYAAADIPETETFGPVDASWIPFFQFAASAATLTGRRLVSAEAFTWLAEHFHVAPAALRETADLLWLGGVNHLFFHGIPYNPDDAPWPGWLFYASTHLGPLGGLWRDLPAFTAYITRIQSALQDGAPDTAVLLYFPVHDAWSQPADRLPQFTAHNTAEWLRPTLFHEVARELGRRGVPCHFVSDDLLAGATVEPATGALVLGGATFRTLLLPGPRLLPAATADRLLALARQGASIAFLGPLPADGPGLGNREQNRTALARLAADPALRHPPDLASHLAACGLPDEPMARHGLRFIRRRHDDGHAWFLANHSGGPLDAWIPLTPPCTAAWFADPADAGRAGWAEVRRIGGQPALHVVLDPGETRLLRTFTSPPPAGPPWRDLRPTRPAAPLRGPWQLTFLEGGPALPAPRHLHELASWTDLGDATVRAFSGTARYETVLDLPGAGPWLLDLGAVAATCRLRIDDAAPVLSFFPPHRILLPTDLTPGRHRLTIEVTSLAANRIADLDRRGVPWKIFHDANVVDRHYRPLDASAWPPLPSGLLGPVTLTPLAP